MNKVDQFESVFRSAVKDPYVYEKIRLTSILNVTDMAEDRAAVFQEKVTRLIQGLDPGSSLSHTTLSEKDYQNAEDLPRIVSETRPDLICTYRNLRSRAWRLCQSLGEHLDVLLQQTDPPVLVMPHPEAGDALDHAFEHLRTVVAVTDHLAKDHRLINYSVAFTEKDGTLMLAHIEDQANFNRIVEAFSKIPEFDTDELEAKLKKQLLKEPMELISSCKEVLAEKGIPIQVKEIVTFGHRLAEYRAHIIENKVDLLVMNLKEDDQFAMHGLVYPLAIELRQIPILLL